MRITRRFLYLCALVVFCGAPVAAAPGTPPVVLTYTYTITDAVFESCIGFDILANGEGSVRVTDYYDHDGNLIRRVFHNLYMGTLTNSATGYTLVDAPEVYSGTTDFVDGTATLTGASITITPPGAGPMFFRAGRRVFESGNPTAIFDVGLDVQQSLCGVMDQ